MGKQSRSRGANPESSGDAGLPPSPGKGCLPSLGSHLQQPQPCPAAARPQPRSHVMLHKSQRAGERWLCRSFTPSCPKCSLGTGAPGSAAQSTGLGHKTPQALPGSSCRDGAATDSHPTSQGRISPPSPIYPCPLQPCHESWHSSPCSKSSPALLGPLWILEGASLLLLALGTRPALSLNPSQTCRVTWSCRAPSPSLLDFHRNLVTWFVQTPCHSELPDLHLKLFLLMGIPK